MLTNVDSFSGSGDFIIFMKLIVIFPEYKKLTSRCVRVVILLFSSNTEVVNVRFSKILLSFIEKEKDIIYILE